MSIWKREDFPTVHVNLQTSPWPGKGRSLFGKSNHWKAKFRKPLCWTPTKEFWFGGKKFIPLYPCIAFETVNHGHVIQKLWDHMVYSQE